MKLTILANVPLDEKGLQEVRELGLEVEVKKTTATIKTKYNPYFKSTWGDFDWIRSQFTEPTDVKAFVTSKKELKAEGITGHIGMYDMADGDTKHDLYIGLPASLDRRAKHNGFKSNLAWLLCHEICHGEEKSHPGPDRTHSMDEQGDLLSLWEEHRLNRTALEQRKNLLGTIVELLKRLSALKQESRPSSRVVNGLQPIVERQAEMVIKEMAKQGHHVRIVDGFRSVEKQDELYAQGRTESGPIVTQAKGGESFHNYGVAVDFVFVKEGYNASTSKWQLLGDIGKKHGFVWGGDWTTFIDRPHFEMLQGYNLKDFQKNKVDYIYFA